MENDPTADVNSIDLPEPPVRPVIKAKPSSTDGEAEEKVEHIIVNTEMRKDGQIKCPKCGSTEIKLRIELGQLVCLYCRHQWLSEAAEKAFGFDSPILEINTTILGSGVQDISEDVSSVVTLKCTSCGAEVVTNTQDALQSRCHWCRNVLSISEQVPNGAVPDAILPFTVTKEDAIAQIRHFVGKRKFFALKKFKKEFSPENVMGVYLPYLTVDGNLFGAFEGEGEVETREYTVRLGKDRTETRYDADVYHVARQFDYTVDDLLIESNSARADQRTNVNTNNVINAILPFDVKESVTYNSNYLSGFSSEKRDINITDLSEEIENRFLSIGRAQATKTISKYDRGVRWEKEHLTVKGRRIIAVYAPIWLYSYYETKGSKSFLHYVAVNGRTKKTMGSVPINKARLLAFSVLAEILSITIGTLILGSSDRYDGSFDMDGNVNISLVHSGVEK